MKWILYRIQKIVREIYNNGNLDAYPHGSVDIIFIQMTHDFNWFESPFPKPNSFLSPPLLQDDLEHEADQSQWNRPIFIAPDVMGSPHDNNHDRLSPWSKMINSEQENRLENIYISGLIPEQSQPEGGINQKMFYSGDEDDDPVTPMQHCKQEEEGEIHTTGRKSQFQNTAKKSRPRQKGLRKLSQRAYEIVQELKKGTYKDVAAKLVFELNDEDMGSEVVISAIQNKQEQNIKRRVYDALNVLIALGVLKKDGRKIVSQKKTKEGEQSESGEYQTLRLKLQAKKAVIEQKKKKLKEAEDKLSCIHTLLHRNEEAEQSQQIIPFPFIGMMVVDSSFDQLKQETSQEFAIKSAEPFQPFGDIDSLKWLKESLERMSVTNERVEENWAHREEEIQEEQLQIKFE